MEERTPRLTAHRQVGIQPAVSKLEVDPPKKEQDAQKGGEQAHSSWSKKALYDLLVLITNLVAYHYCAIGAGPYLVQVNCAVNGERGAK